MVTCQMQIMASQVLEVIPTEERCETQGNETDYLKLARISPTKLEHQFLDLDCCEWGFLFSGHVPRMHLHASRSCFTIVCCNGDGGQAFGGPMSPQKLLPGWTSAIGVQGSMLSRDQVWGGH